MKSKDTQWRKRTWVPSLSNRRLLRPSTDFSPYDEDENVNERTPSFSTLVRDGNPMKWC